MKNTKLGNLVSVQFIDSWTVNGVKKVIKYKGKLPMTCFTKLGNLKRSVVDRKFKRKGRNGFTIQTVFNSNT